MRDGMLMDATLQAILRGHARMGSEGRCGDCEVIVFQTKQRGLSDDQWRRMFPDVHLINDRVLVPREPLVGRALELAEIVQRRLAAGETDLSNPSLYDEMGMNRSNFARLIRSPAWQDHMADLGLTQCTLKGRVQGLRLG